MKPVRAAGVDIGTNSVRILIAEVEGSGEKPDLRTLYRLMNITRLGQGVDERGYLSGDAVERTASVLCEYRELMREESVEAWDIAATSAAPWSSSSAQRALRHANRMKPSRKLTLGTLCAYCLYGSPNFSMQP